MKKTMVAILAIGLMCNVAYGISFTEKAGNVMDSALTTGETATSTVESTKATASSAKSLGKGVASDIQEGTKDGTTLDKLSARQEEADNVKANAGATAEGAKATTDSTKTTGKAVGDLFKK